MLWGGELQTFEFGGRIWELSQRAGGEEKLQAFSAPEARGDRSSSFTLYLVLVFGGVGLTSVGRNMSHTNYRLISSSGSCLDSPLDHIYPPMLMRGEWYGHICFLDTLFHSFPSITFHFWASTIYWA